MQPAVAAPAPRRRPRAIADADRAAPTRDGRAADGVLAADHHRRLPADLPAPAGRGPHLRADGATPWSRRCVGALSSRSRSCRCWRPSRYRKPRRRTASRRSCAGAARLYVPTAPRALRRPACWCWRGAGLRWRRGASCCRGSAPSSCPSSTRARSTSPSRCPSNISLDRGAQARRRRITRDARPASPRSTSCCRSSGAPRTAPTPRCPTTSSSSSSCKPPKQWPPGHPDARRRRSRR